MAEQIRPLEHLVVLSGMSGAGKSVALHTLEDMGYDCVDNLPVELLTECVRSLSMQSQVDDAPARIAIAIDVRSRSDLAQIPTWLSSLGQAGHDPQLVFIDSNDDALLKRYAETRRRHPLSHLGLGLADAIQLERQVLKPLRVQAAVSIDSSAMNVHQLRREVIAQLNLGHEQAPLLLFESFAYKRGIPADADFVMDARVLPNPHWEAQLRPLSGRDAPVREYLEAQPEVQTYLEQIKGFMDTWLPKMRSDTRSYITVAFGCTGGRHRSVYLAEAMARHARANGWPDASTFHRELD